MTLYKKLIILFLSLFTIVFGNDAPLKFKRLTINEGLSNSTVNCMVQDSLGFIWVGTENGLNRFDGYKFTSFYSDFNRHDQLQSNEILSLLIDRKGQLWIGTFDGLYKYDQALNIFESVTIDQINLIDGNIPVYALCQDDNDDIWVGTSGNGLVKLREDGSFIANYYHAKGDPTSVSSNYIFSLKRGADGKFWIGTTDNGLDCFDPKTNTFTNYKPIAGIASQQNTNAILKIYELDDHHFLLGTRGDGLFKFNLTNKTFTPFRLDADAESLVNSYEIYEIFEDSKSNLWISVHGRGLYCFKEGNPIPYRIEHVEGEPTSLINNNVRSIIEDEQGNLWIASFQGGLNLLPNMVSRFKNYDLNEVGSVYQSPTVTSIAKSRNGDIWIGTDGAGLKYIASGACDIQHFYPGKSTSTSIPDKVVMTLLDDGDELWLGSYLAGLSVYNKSKKTFRNYSADGKEGSLNVNFITTIHKAQNGVIWIGTNGGGVNIYDKETDLFSSLQDVVDENGLSLPNSYINCITEDNNGRLWIGTYWGISVYDPHDQVFVNYDRRSKGGNGLSDNTIFSIIYTSKNEVWLGTRNGLNKFLPERNIFQSFSIRDGLPGNVIFSLEEDDDGLLWMSTNNGICCFNPDNYETKNYFKNDGLKSNEFFRGASYKAANGEIFFGGINGLNSFFPDSITESYAIPQPRVVGLSIFNEEVLPGTEIDGCQVLEKSIVLTDTVELKQRLNNFELEFSTMDYILPEKNSFQCKLVGFDQDWHVLGLQQHYITYTNLDAGTYTLLLKVSNVDNEWGSATESLTIIITPPFYRTWWAYGVFALIVLFAIIYLWRFTIHRVKLQNEIRLERVERSKMQEINQAKLQFFTNISHEFRTPISLILGPLESMRNDKSLTNKYGDKISLMMKNSNRLMHLVNQLMDLRKLENGKMQLRVQEDDIILFLKGTFDNFKDFAERKGIDFSFNTEVERQVIFFDKDKLDNVMFNLLSNAFKFTPRGGRIFIEVSHSDRFLNIEVIDTGCGISSKTLPQIFQRFFQKDDKEMAPSIGSGVGLSLTKSLVEQHHGQIDVFSTLEIGTTFRVCLPLDVSNYSENERASISNKDHSDVIDYGLEGLDYECEDDDTSSEGESTILIVEDNKDLRKYLKSELSDKYKILEAENGEVGFRVALDKLPDLVISDVMMPIKDGLEMCQMLKSHFFTNHIPIILLTAKASVEQRIVGLEHGADSYIPKPFVLGHLKVRIRKLMEMRMVLRQRYSQELESSEPHIVVEDDKYLKHVNDFVLKHLNDLDLNIERLCQDLGVSRSHFYRKIKLLTGKSPTEYVRVLRLNEAVHIMSSTSLSVSEVCFSVGFNSPSYFSNSFKQQFKMTPVEFMKKNKKLVDDKKTS